jgi:transposase
VGDTTTIHQRVEEPMVADKGYHSGAVLQELHAEGIRSYIPEPERGRRHWPREGKAVEQQRV